MAKTDYRSAEAAEYRKLYKTRLWQVTRLHQLAEEPLCRMCKQRGKITPAKVCDHVNPHKGNVELFYSGPFQSLCRPCHDQTKQRVEARGFDFGSDIGGRPTDTSHPWNRT